MIRWAFIVAFAIFVSGPSCAQTRTPQVVRGQFFLDGVFEITLDRRLGNNEVYPYEMKLVTKDGRSLNECEGNLANDTAPHYAAIPGGGISTSYAPPAQAFRERVRGSCIHGNPERDERGHVLPKGIFDLETVESHVGPGKIQSVVIILGADNDSPLEFKEIGRWTFGPL